MSILKVIEKILCPGNSKSSSLPGTGSRHYTSAISDGLRNGSSEAGKVMAKWRWKNTGKML